MSDALFDLPDAQRPAPPPETPLSQERRRTIRQRATLAAGYHPLGLVLKRPVRLHPDAAPADDRTAPGLRCGDCRFREIAGRPVRSFAKCAKASATYGPASDNRKWWPACRHFEAKAGSS